MTDPADVVIVGGGPAGLAAASWLARWGHHVVVVDRGRRRRRPDGAETAGEPLPWGQFVSPRAVQRLIELGVDPLEQGWHRHGGAHLRLGGRTLEVPWSTDGGPLRTSVGVTRDVLAQTLSARARQDGVSVLDEHEAVSAVIERGFVRGTSVRSLADGSSRDLRAPFVIVADGAGSTFGRALGTLRTTNWPSLTTVQSTWPSGRGGEPWMEVRTGVVDPEGERLTAITTVTPLGEGRVSVEVAVPSTSRQSASINVTGLFDQVAHGLAPDWGLDLSRPGGRQRSERLPVGLSIRPHAGPTFVVIGNAVGAVNPFNGDGLAFGLESARLAAEAVHVALRDGDPMALATYSRQLEQRLGGFFKLGRFALRTLGHTRAVETIVGLAGRTPRTTARVARFMAGLADVATPADPAQRAALALARSLPEA